MTKRQYLAFDIGAESGRALLAHFDGQTIHFDEIHRFSNEPVLTAGELHWDVLRIWHEMQRGLNAAYSFGAESLAGVGVDTWGVDFALLGEGGALLGNPFHYRDPRTDGVLDRILTVVPAQEIYAATGIQFMQINTLCQLYAAQERTPKLLARAETFLTIPDLLNYWLTGTQSCEFTNATTTQMFDPVRRDWARPLLEKLGLPTQFLRPVVDAGTVLGPLREELLSRSGLRSATVIAPACHDTGSAVAAISSEGQTAFISSGTWSLMGAEIPSPVVNEAARKANFTNEGGVCGTTRLLKNIMGMWLLQSCRKEWNNLEYGALVALASSKPSLRAIVDPDHPAFLHPRSMTEALKEYCRTTGQPEPREPADFVQIVLESLALKYRYVLDLLRKVTGRNYTGIRVVGGGARNRVLNQFTAEATGCRVLAGPVEATALGNIVMQLVATGAVGSLEEARQIVDHSFPVEVFEPSDPALWDVAYRRVYE